METLLNDFSPGLFAMQIVLLLGLIFLLVKFAWKPILTSLNEREEGIKDALESADKARRDMQNLQADNEKLAKEARAERDAMLKEAREIKDKMISNAKDEAKKAAEKMIEMAQDSIEKEKQVALSEIKNQVAELSIGIAESVVKRELKSKNDQLKLVEELLEDITLK